jgi:flagellum-specific peptidoglycan hydrolase FlgJ
MNNLFRLLRILTCAFLILGFQRPVFAQSEVRLAYIERFKDIAIFEMQTHKIPASIKLAQGILESGDGSSRLARDANNHFGIKCHTDWTGKRVYHDDDEKGECFRKYKDPAESYRDHSLFLVERSRYRALFELEITDYKAWAKGLRAAGYATNPKYSDLLIRIIEDYQLYQYDNVFFHRERMSGIFRHPNRVKFTAVEQSETIE